MKPVPDFFQTKTPQARLDQIRWLTECYALPESFFARVLRQEAHAALDDPDAVLGMERLWPMFLHLMSFVDFSVKDGARLIHAQWESSDASGSLDVPWAGRSIRGYLEEQGLAGAVEVDRWLTSFRHMDRYARPATEVRLTRLLSSD
jgi:hypothetical protein